MDLGIDVDIIVKLDAVEGLNRKVNHHELTPLAHLEYVVQECGADILVVDVDLADSVAVGFGVVVHRAVAVVCEEGRLQAELGRMNPGRPLGEEMARVSSKRTRNKSAIIL